MRFKCPWSWLAHNMQALCFLPRTQLGLDGWRARGAARLVVGGDTSFVLVDPAVVPPLAAPGSDPEPAAAVSNGSSGMCGLQFSAATLMSAAKHMIVISRLSNSSASFYADDELLHASWLSAGSGS